MTTEQQQRKVFEEWADSMGYSTFQYKDPDEYVSDDTYTTWVAWQAASKELATVTEQRDRLAEALRECREDSVELLGERCFWQNEPRCGHDKRYQVTRDNVNRADEALQSLTTNEL